MCIALSIVFYVSFNSIFGFVPSPIVVDPSYHYPNLGLSY